MVVCCGCSCTPTLNRAIPPTLSDLVSPLDAEDFDPVLLDPHVDGRQRRQVRHLVRAGRRTALVESGAMARALELGANTTPVEHAGHVGAECGQGADRASIADDVALQRPVAEPDRRLEGYVIRNGRTVRALDRKSTRLTPVTVASRMPSSA